MTDRIEDEKEVRGEPVQPLPLVRVYGEGYITRKDGTVVPFTFEGED